jgi:hypothetical protein
MFGLLTEIGPLVFTGETLESGDPKLVANPYSWTREADILIFDAPPPIGFSYCEPAGPEGQGTACGDWNDTRTTRVNLAALKAFLKRFPSLLTRDLYLAGESYAGVYIPSLARAILEAKEAGDAILSKIRLKGFAVGDACVGTDVLCGDDHGPYFDVEFFAGHHQFSRQLYRDIFSTCGESALKTGRGLTAACLSLLEEMHAQVGGYYEYGLYDDCTYSNPFTGASSARAHLLSRSLSSLGLSRYGATPGYARWRRRSQLGNGGAQASGGGGKAGRAGGEARVLQEESVKTGEGWAGMGTAAAWAETGAKGALNDYSCGSAQALFSWVTLPQVRKALHVPLNSNWFCADNGQGFVYKITEKNLMPFYLDVLQGKYAAQALRVLVYNGDTDPSINSLAAENWTAALNLEIAREWRPWTTDGCRRMGGSVVEYRDRFAFLTVRGAGHMVPQYKPVAAAAFMRAWLRDQAFPAFNASCSSPNHVPARGAGDVRLEDVVI